MTGTADRIALAAWAVALIGIGVPLAFPRSRAVGGAIIAAGLLLLGWNVFRTPLVARLRVRGRKSSGDIAAWLHRCADFGTDNIQNAAIASPPEVVTKLRPLFFQWNQIVSEGVLAYCRESDAKRIEYLDTFAWRRLPGVNPEHARIREMTAETVSRMRDLAARLERGETRLK